MRSTSTTIYNNFESTLQPPLSTHQNYSSVPSSPRIQSSAQKNQSFVTFFHQKIPSRDTYTSNSKRSNSVQPNPIRSQQQQRDNSLPSNQQQLKQEIKKIQQQILQLEQQKLENLTEISKLQKSNHASMEDHLKRISNGKKEVYAKEKINLIEKNKLTEQDYVNYYSKCIQEQEQTINTKKSQIKMMTYEIRQSEQKKYIN